MGWQAWDIGTGVQGLQCSVEQVGEGDVLSLAWIATP